MKRIIIAILASVMLALPAIAQEQPTCAYCDQPWDTKTRVIAVLADDDGSELYHFDSIWHYLEYLWHADAEDESYNVVLAGAEDFSTTEAKPSSWLAIKAGFADDANTYVWTEAAFPGARKAPFVAAFGRRAAAETFQRQHGGDLLSGTELFTRMKARWDESHGPGGAEK